MSKKWYAATIALAKDGPAHHPTFVVIVSNNAGSVRVRAKDDIVHYAGAIAEVVIGTVEADSIEDAAEAATHGQWHANDGISHLIDSKLGHKPQFLRVERSGY